MLALYHRLTIAVCVALLVAIGVEACAIKEIRLIERPSPIADRGRIAGW